MMTTYYLAESSHSFVSPTLDSTLHVSASHAWQCVAMDWAASYDEKFEHYEESIEFLASCNVPAAVTMGTGETFTVRAFNAATEDIDLYTTPEDAERFASWPQL